MGHGMEVDICFCLQVMTTSQLNNCHRKLKKDTKKVVENAKKMKKQLRISEYNPVQRSLPVHKTASIYCRIV